MRIRLIRHYCGKKATIYHTELIDSSTKYELPQLKIKYQNNISTQDIIRHLEYYKNKLFYRFLNKKIKTLEITEKKHLWVDFKNLLGFGEIDEISTTRKIQKKNYYYSNRPKIIRLWKCQSAVVKKRKYAPKFKLYPVFQFYTKNGYIYRRRMNKKYSRGNFKIDSGYYSKLKLTN